MSTTNFDSKERKGYRVLILMLVALAVLSSALKDIERLQQLASNLEELTAAVTGHSFFTASAATTSENGKHSALPLTPTSLASPQTLAGEFRWTGRVATGQTIEIRGLNGDIAADGSSGSEVEVVANKQSRRSDVNLVSIKVVEHAGGVTICAIYPTDDPNRTTVCEPSGTAAENPSSNTSVVTKNDVRVDFRVRVPAGVNVAARTVNGEINAEALASNVSVKTVNGSIKISTSGYAEAKTVNGEISARLGNVNWPGSLQFKTVNGAINLDLPAGTNASVQAKTFNGTINSDFPLTILGKFGKREVSGIIGSGGRELLLKTLNGSINLRRAG